MLPEQQMLYGGQPPAPFDFNGYPQQQPGVAMGATPQMSMPPEFQPSLHPNGSVLIPNIDSAFTTTDNQFPNAQFLSGRPVGPQFPSEQQTVTSPRGMTSLPSSGVTGYTGAGYVQRGTESEGSGYILLSTAGKVLAHLNPAGDVDLEAHIGHAVGVKGRRYFDESVKADRIDVNGLEDVTIK